MTAIKQLRELLREIDTIDRDRNDWKDLGNFATAIVARICEANGTESLDAPSDRRLEELHAMAQDGKLHLIFGFHDLTPVIVADDGTTTKLCHAGHANRPIGSSSQPPP